MESIILLKRINQKHWQARLSCSNCLPPCCPTARAPVLNQACSTGLCGPEAELTFSSLDSDYKLYRRRSNQDFPLEFLPCSAPSPESQPKIDKEIEVKPEYTLEDKPLRQGKSETELEDSKAENQVKSENKEKCPSKREAKAELKKKGEDRCCKKICPNELTADTSQTEAKATPKGASKPSKAAKEPPKTASKVASKAALKDPPEESKKLSKPDKAEPKKYLEPDTSTTNIENNSATSARSNPDSSAQQHIDPCFPPGSDEKVQKIVMGKEETKKRKSKSSKPSKPKPPKEPKLERKSSAKSKKPAKTKDKDKKKKPEKMKRFEPKKLKNNPTFTQIGGSVGHNCCSCLDAIGLYIKEFLRFSCSLTTGRPAQDTEFQERVCDMLNILRTMCRDCFYLLRYVLRILFVD